jgi:hypothetical protein
MRLVHTAIKSATQSISGGRWYNNPSAFENVFVDNDALRGAWDRCGSGCAGLGFRPYKGVR